jgi:hypothetical protein
VGSIPDGVIGFFFDWIFSRIMALWWTHPLTEMSTRNLPGVKGCPPREVVNFTAIFEPTV